MGPFFVWERLLSARPMTKAVLFVLLACSTAACKRSRSCDTAITNAIEVGKAEKVMPADTAKSAKVKDAMIAHCKADAWAEDVVACYGDAADNEHLSGCIDKLTKDQQDKLMKDLAPIMSNSGSGGAP